MKPLLVGAGHEHDLRPGTKNVPTIVGFGKAAEIAMDRTPTDTSRLFELRNHFHLLLERGVPGLILNGHPTERLPNTLNVSFPNVDGRGLLSRTAGEVATSVGSACHEEEDAVSGVLGAMGVSAGRRTGSDSPLSGSSDDQDPDRNCRCCSDPGELKAQPVNCMKADG